MSISTVGIVGAGTMGNGIAQACAVRGIRVVMVDINEAAVQRGLTTVSSSLDRLLLGLERSSELSFAGSKRSDLAPQSRGSDFAGSAVGGYPVEIDHRDDCGRNGLRRSGGWSQHGSGGKGRGNQIFAH